MTTTPQTAVESVTLRPSRRPLLFTGPLVVADTLVVVLLLFTRVLEFERGTLFLLGLYLPFGGLLVLLAWSPWSYALLMVSGSTEVRADGLVNRRVKGSARIGWQDIRSIEVRRTPFGRRAFVVLKKRRRRVRLAAPHDGLLVPAGGFDSGLARLRDAATAAGVHTVERPRLSRPVGWTVACVIGCLLVTPVLCLTRPWLDPWWPGRHEVVLIPRACDIPGIAPLVPGLHRTSGHYSARSQTSACEWAVSEPRRSGDPELSVDLRWDRRGFSADAEHRAHDDFTRDKDAESDQGPVPGLGDEAIESFTRPDSSGVWGEVIVRRANVIIEVRFGAKPGDQVPATAERVARVVVARLTVTRLPRFAQ